MDKQTRMVLSAGRDAMTDLLGLERADAVMEAVIESPAFNDATGLFVQAAIENARISNRKPRP